MNILKEMLLIEDPSVFKLYQEMMTIAKYFLAPVFTIALILEFFGNFDFGSVLKKLLLITVFMSAFYGIHQKAVEVSLQSATYTLKKVSPRNLFIKKWYHVKAKTSEKKEWSKLEAFAIPNLNDLVATAFFVLSKIFIWLLKLIYSTVYHLTYVFAGVTAIFYFLGWTKDALKGTVQSSLWCMLMPFVIVVILALVGNSIDEAALKGELIVAEVNTIIWLFGVTLLLLISPLITYGMIKGDGVHSFGSKMGSMVTASGLKAMALYPILASRFKGASGTLGNLTSKAFFEPSLNDLIKKEGIDKAKMMNKKGGLKNPFKAPKNLQERLQEVGMKKTEAVTLSKNSSNLESNKKSNSEVKPRQEKKSFDTKMKPAQMENLIGQLRPTENKDNAPEQFVKLRKENFKFNQKYWDNIHPRHADAIKKKYGIEGNTVDPRKVHRPKKTEVKRPQRREKLNELR